MEVEEKEGRWKARETQAALARVRASQMARTSWKSSLGSAVRSGPGAEGVEDAPWVVVLDSPSSSFE